MSHRRRVGQHDVVVFRPFDFKQAQVRLGPVHAIHRFGAATDFHRAAVASRLGQAAIVHAVAVAVADHRAVAAERTFPRLIELHRDPFIARRMQNQPHVLQRVNEEMIDQQLPPRTNFQRRIVRHEPSGTSINSVNTVEQTLERSPYVMFEFSRILVRE